VCDAATTAWPAAARSLAGLHGQEIAVRRIGSELGAGDVVAEAGSWHLAYGVEPEGAVLVRPDGFIAQRWCTAPADPAAALADAVLSALAWTA
jgi:putative polyketide hydroxylase